MYAKAEYYNLTGSIKDRVAYHILKKAYESGEIHSQDVIAEATSGNTGISFSAMGSLFLGHPVMIYMPDWMSRERITLMESYGARVHLVSHEEGGFLGSIRMTEELAAQGGVFLPQQFSNEDNTEAHELTTGEEIAAQLRAFGKKADAVVAGVGTGGTVMGIARRLKKGKPRLPGVSAGAVQFSRRFRRGIRSESTAFTGFRMNFIPDILKLEETDGVISVDDGDAIRMARMPSEKLGIGVGVSSGANFLGCLKAQEMLGAARRVTVFADDNKKYLSTDYSAPQETKDGYLTNDITLLGAEVKR